MKHLTQVTLSNVNIHYIIVVWWLRESH